MFEVVCLFCFLRKKKGTKEKWDAEEVIVVVRKQREREREREREERSRKAKRIKEARSTPSKKRKNGKRYLKKKKTLRTYLAGPKGRT